MIWYSNDLLKVIRGNVRNVYYLESGRELLKGKNKLNATL